MDLDERRDRYRAVILDRAAAELAAAGEGARNATLNAEAFALGRSVGGGVLSRVEAEALLSEQAEIFKLPAKEARYTIRRSLNEGERQPQGWPTDIEPGQPSRPPRGRRRTPCQTTRPTPRPIRWAWEWEHSTNPLGMGGAAPWTAAAVAEARAEALAEKAAIVGEALAAEALTAGTFTNETEALAWGWAEGDRLAPELLRCHLPEVGAERWSALYPAALRWVDLALAAAANDLLELVRVLSHLSQGTPPAPDGWGAGALAALALDAAGEPVGLRGVNVEECPGEAPRIAALPPWGVAPGLLADPHGLALLRGAPAPELRGVLLAGDLAEWAKLAAQAAREGAPLAVLGVCPGDAPALAAAAAHWPAHLELAALPACVRTVNTALAPLGRRALEVDP